MNRYLIEIKWAVIFITVSLVWIFLENQAGLHDERIAYHERVTLFFIIPSLAIYLFALLDKRKNFYGGGMSWKQGFSAGMVITIAIVILVPLEQLIAYTVISPEYFPNMTDYNVSQGWMTEEEAGKWFNLKNSIIMGAGASLALGTLTSLLVAVFTRKNKPVVN